MVDSQDVNAQKEKSMSLYMQSPVSTSDLCSRRLLSMRRISLVLLPHPLTFPLALQLTLTTAMPQHVTIEGSSDAAPPPDLASLMLTAMSLDSQFIL
jgi:hypothetical protein